VKEDIKPARPAQPAPPPLDPAPPAPAPDTLKLRCLRWFKDGNITGKRVFEEGEVAEFPKPIARQLLAQRGAWEVVK